MKLLGRGWRETGDGALAWLSSRQPVFKENAGVVLCACNSSTGEVGRVGISLAESVSPSFKSQKTKPKLEPKHNQPTYEDNNETPKPPKHKQAQNKMHRF